MIVVAVWGWGISVSPCIFSGSGFMPSQLKWCHKRWSGTLSDIFCCRRWGPCFLLPSLVWKNWDHVLFLIYHRCIGHHECRGLWDIFLQSGPFSFGIHLETFLDWMGMHLNWCLPRCVLNIVSSELLCVRQMLKKVWLCISQAYCLFDQRNWGTFAWDLLCCWWLYGLIIGEWKWTGLGKGLQMIYDLVKDELLNYGCAKDKLLHCSLVKGKPLVGDVFSGCCA